MDLGTYSRATRAQEGEWMHVLHPETMRPLYMQSTTPLSVGDTVTDKPVRVLVQGVYSPELRAMSKAHEGAMAKLRAKLGRATGAGDVAAIQSQITEATEKFGLSLIAAAIKGWENFVFNGEVLAFSDAAKEKIIPKAGELDCPTDWLIEQVSLFSQDRSNFFMKAPQD